MSKIRETTNRFWRPAVLLLFVAAVTGVVSHQIRHTHGSHSIFADKKGGKNVMVASASTKHMHKKRMANTYPPGMMPDNNNVTW